jgi:hypothetical protein
MIDHHRHGNLNTMFSIVAINIGAFTAAHSVFVICSGVSPQLTQSVGNLIRHAVGIADGKPTQAACCQ